MAVVGCTGLGLLVLARRDRVEAAAAPRSDVNSERRMIDDARRYSKRHQFCTVGV